MDGDNAYINELEKSLSIMRTFLDNSEAGMYVADYYTDDILYANRKTLSAMGGVAVEEVIGRKCWTIVNSKRTERCPFCPYEKLLGADGKPLPPYTWENYFGEFDIWLKIISQVIYWVDGRLAKIMTYYDITENKKMEEKLAALAREDEHRKMQENMQMILDLLPMPIRIIDLESGVIVYGNKAAFELLKVSPEEAIGESMYRFLPETQPDGSKTEYRARVLDRSNPYTVEVQCIRSDGKPLDLRVTACVVEYNGKKASLGIMEDLAAEKEHERILRQAAEKEREANNLKSNFLSNMSHEVRTPMNAIIGLTEIELRKNQPKECLEIYKKINISAKNLLQIVNDILDLSKIEADKLELFPDEFELEDVLNSALLVVSPRLEGKRVELMLNVSLELPRFMVGDRIRLWQILKNYLDNAAKFTQEGNIILTISEDKSQSTAETIAVYFEIADTGVGMNEEQLKKAFRPYEQVYNEAQRRFVGTGLGLPISKRLCDLMNSSVSIESKSGEGTVIRFTIPFQRSINSETEEQSLPTLSGLRFLIVDDDEISLEIMGGLLGNCNANYVSADSGEEALRITRAGEQMFDVILLDYMMKGINGLETAKELQNDMASSAKLLMVTAYESLLLKDELQECGIDDIIEKPFIPSIFVEKIRTAVGCGSSNAQEPIKTYTKFKDVDILVCEDNEFNQEVAAGMLEEFGMFPVFAQNGSQAIEILNTGKLFDIILMDLHMPVMDGYEATRAIRLEKRFDEIPIISLTADAMTEVIDKCLACGMNDYLSKPMDLDHLYKVFMKWLPESKRSE